MEEEGEGEARKRKEMDLNRAGEKETQLGAQLYGKREALKVSGDQEGKGGRERAKNKLSTFPSFFLRRVCTHI